MTPLRSLLVTLAALMTMASPCLAGALTKIPAAGDGQDPLPVYLSRPTGAGPFPAVVVLHQCTGFDNVVATWTDRLASWGYVAIAVDSLSSRGRKSGCNGGANEQVHDAYRALDFLATQPFVLADRIGLLGMSLGGNATLVAFERGGIERLFPRQFRAAVAFYPFCPAGSGIMMGPTLVLVGELDDWTLADDCRDMVSGKSGIGVARAPGDRSMVDLVVYPDAHHAFLTFEAQAGVRFMGHWLQYNETAAQDASKRVHGFFQRTLEN